jgi:hypothetical protein
MSISPFLLSSYVVLMIKSVKLFNGNMKRCSTPKKQKMCEIACDGNRYLGLFKYCFSNSFNHYLTSKLKKIETLVEPLVMKLVFGWSF